MLTQKDIQNTIAFLGEIAVKGEYADILVDLKRKYISMLEPVSQEKSTEEEPG